MDIAKVIESGKQLVAPGFQMFDLEGGIHSFLDMRLGWILLGLFVLFLIIRKDFMGGIVTLAAMFSMVIILFMSINAAFDKRDAYLNEEKKWKEEVAMPYIESLPKERREIVFIKIDPELGGKSERGRYSHPQNVELTPLTISYVDNDTVVTRTEWYKTYMKLTDETKPYIEFQRLEQDLGHDVNKGVYNAVVYMPKSYEFTDIK